jgi:hypothetical protein
MSRSPRKQAALVVGLTETWLLVTLLRAVSTYHELTGQHDQLLGALGTIWQMVVYYFAGGLLLLAVRLICSLIKARSSS